MKYLIITTILALATFGCDVFSTDSDKPKSSKYPYIQETWKVWSADSAEWIGKNKAGKVKIPTTQDTTVIETASEKHMYIKEDTTKGFNIHRGYFTLTIVDSALTISHFSDSIKTIEVDTKEKYEFLGYNRESYTSHSIFRISGVFECLNVESSNTLYLNYLGKNREIYKTTSFNVEGFTTTLDSIACDRF